MGDLLLLFLFGMIWDAVISLDTWATSKEKPALAGGTTFLLTIVSVVFYNEALVVQGFQLDRVIALASGSAFGTWALIRFVKGKHL